MSILIEGYRPHAFFYLRSVNDLSVPWVPSPLTPARPLPPSSVGSPRTKKTLQFRIPDSSPLSPLLETGTRASERRKHRHLSFLRSVKKRLKPRKTESRKTVTPVHKILEVEIEQCDPAELEPSATVTPPVPLSDWKAWSYYARPCVNGVNVNNLSPKPKLDVEIDVQMLFDYLKSPGGTPHPERWIKGQKHPALPPRPAAWKRVDPNEPVPFPWEVQLNPLISHSIMMFPGFTPLFWNIKNRPELVFFLTEDGGLQFAMDNDLCQPATCPLVTHMYICAYAFAPEWNVQYRLPWPLMLQCRDGITCEDIVIGFYQNFNQDVSQREYEKWDEEIQRSAKKSHAEEERGWTEDYRVKRADFFGDNVYYRGLAPSLNVEGWVMFLGPEPPMMIKDYPW
ncbi:hypothetical protein F5878DRAFT_102967 [Lentinula raphanica]|uniref:DUF6699 domain-containing protein n=1 Tax=Lentinula raphanica TaxID=153919 RepID=A0AA38PBE0_9AGAR|nr:hypothetical protein F5878DRAFT_102967 [Lentinula raphanica]